MQSCATIESHGGLATQDATPANFILFELTEHGSAGGRLQVLVRRPSDGASKLWTVNTLVRRDNDVASLVASSGGNAPIGDTVALSGTAIAFFTDGVNVGLTLTGRAGELLNWCILFDGVQGVD